MEANGIEGAAPGAAEYYFLQSEYQNRQKSEILNQTKEKTIQSLLPDRQATVLWDFAFAE